MDALVINKNFVGLFDDGVWGYKQKHFVHSEGDIIIDLDKPFHCQKGIYSGGKITSNVSIISGKGTKAVSDIVSGGSISARHFIVGDNIEARDEVVALGVVAKGGLRAGKYIRVQEHIKVEKSIVAGHYITCKESLFVGLKIFAGVSFEEDTLPQQRKITVGKLESGKIEYGELEELGLPQPPEIIIVNGKEYKLQN